MTDYIPEFMQWVDESGPLVRGAFVAGLILMYLLIIRFIRRITNRLAANVTEEKRFDLRIQSQVIVSARGMADPSNRNCHRNIHWFQLSEYCHGPV
jgi:hypothetical protein